MNSNPSAKRILFYGDSLVFGKVPGGTRYLSNERLTGIVQNELGNDYEVIEEGLRGRTAGGENAFFPHRNGLEQFGPIFGSHLSLDVVMLFLGTNDINSGGIKILEDLGLVFKEYQTRIEWWASHLDFARPDVILIAPPVINEEHTYKLFKDIFKGAQVKSQKLSSLYENIASSLSWGFFDSSKIVKSSDIDGVHLSKESNQILGVHLAKLIKARN